MALVTAVRIIWRYQRISVAIQRGNCMCFSTSFATDSTTDECDEKATPDHSLVFISCFSPRGFFAYRGKNKNKKFRYRYRRYFYQKYRYRFRLQKALLAHPYNLPM